MQRLLLLICLTLSATTQASVGYRIDQSFCEGRGTMGSMIIESRHRGVSKTTMLHDLRQMRKAAPEGSMFWVLEPMAEMDLNGLYKTPKSYTPKQAYLDLHNSCRDLRGMIVKL